MQIAKNGEEVKNISYKCNLTAKSYNKTNFTYSSVLYVIICIIRSY